MFINSLAAEFIYPVTSAERAGPIYRSTTGKGIDFAKIRK